MEQGQLLPTTTSAVAKRPVQLPAKQLAPAMTVWLGSTWVVSYVVFPLLLSSLLPTSYIGSLLFNTPGFAVASLVTMVSALTLSPKIELRTHTKRDPVGMAVFGGMLAWAILQNTVPGLLTFASMSGTELLASATLNLFEFSLLAMLLSSFTRSKTVAFGLGFLFQILQVGVSIALFL